MISSGNSFQMRWLSHFSFSFSSHSNSHSLPSSSSPSAVSSPKASSDESFPSPSRNHPVNTNSKTSTNFHNNNNINNSSNNNNNNDHNMVINNHRTINARGSALGLSSNSNGGPRLTRGRKLRHLTDQETVPAKPLPKSASDAAAPLVPRSPGRSISPTVPSSRLAAVPLPLPLPLPDHLSPGDGEDGVHPSAASHIGSEFGGREARKAANNLEIRPTRMRRPDFSSGDNYRDNFGINVPTKSAPTSPFASPTVSPQRVSTNNRADTILLNHQTNARGTQVWSAPEMVMLDTQGLPPPAFMDVPAFSPDTSPLHSPQNRSPRRSNFRSPSGPLSPLNGKLSVDPLIAWRESNANQEVHPLPLPPGAAVLSPLATVPQVIARSESTPLTSQWQKGKLIGRGTFGSVYEASNRITGALCAMKEVEIFPDDPKSAECIKQLEQEIKVLSQLQHQNIVQYYGSEIVEDRFYIYLEYVHPGSINRYIRDHCGAMTENVVRSFTRHILSGLAYLHSKKTIHRDIKGANLLVDASGVVKLADFGMAKHLSGHSAHLSLKGSPYWMAPELMQVVMQKDNSSDLAFAVDIWSLGCTIIEMFTGKPPWSEYEGAAAMFKVMRDTPPIPESLSPDGKDFLCCCLQRSPAERSTASMLLEHRWLKTWQQLDVLCSSQLINGIKLTDAPHSPRISDARPDQLPVLPSRSIRGKVNTDGQLHAASFSHCKTG